MASLVCLAGVISTSKDQGNAGRCERDANAGLRELCPRCLDINGSVDRGWHQMNRIVAKQMN